MADFKYESLTDSERKAEIDTRLQGLERDRFRIELDVLSGNDAQKARLDDLTERIAQLRAMRDELS